MNQEQTEIVILNQGKNLFELGARIHKLEKKVESMKVLLDNAHAMAHEALILTS